MEGDLKIVEFDKWCNTCRYYETEESEDPCRECLTIGARPDSRRPERYWAKTGVNKDRKSGDRIT